MKKRLTATVLAAVLLVITFSCTGCLKQKEPPKKSVKFWKLTQQERKDYICDYLEKEYGLSCKIDGEVFKKCLAPFLYDDNFFALAITPDNDTILVWISDYGKITDTAFMLDMRSELADFFTDILAKTIPEFKLDTNTTILGTPSKKLTRAEDIHDFLMSENTWTCLNIFVDDPSIANEELLDELEQELNFCEASIYIYVCEDLDCLDLNSYDIHSYQYSRGVNKVE